MLIQSESVKPFYSQHLRFSDKSVGLEKTHSHICVQFDLIMSNLLFIFHQ